MEQQVIWMKVTKDAARLPILIADTAAELAWLAGVRTATVIDAVKNPDSPYVRIKFDKKS